MSLLDVILLRYNSDGSLDTSFVSTVRSTTSSGAVRTAVHALALQTDGKIIAGGTAEGRFWVARYTPEGRLETTFGTDGKVTTRIGSSDTAQSVAYAQALQGDGKLVCFYPCPTYSLA